MIHKHIGSQNCSCGYHGVNYRAVGSHIGFQNRLRGLACDVKFHFLKWSVIVKVGQKNLQEVVKKDE